jgi:tetraacyldisaccharide 4'-kinase
VSRGIVAPGKTGPSFAFCGIARPENFFSELRAAGIRLVGTKAFSDHHAYSRSDVQQLRSLRDQHSASSFLTTEKDAINLGSFASELAPLHIVPVEMRLDDPDATADGLLARIAQRNARPT